MIGSDLRAAVRRGSVTPELVAIKEGWDQRDRENKISNCSLMPNTALVFPLIKILVYEILVYEILLATVLH